MNVNDVITKLKVMLSSDEVAEPIAEVVEEVTMAEAVLVDGTEVYTEGELEVGAILFVRAGEGVSEDPFAPEGMHELSTGEVVTVGENGEITKIEDQEAEAVTAEEEEVEMEEEEGKEEEKFEIKELVEAIAEMILPQTEVIEELRKELSTLKERFEVVADQPAAKPVAKNTFSEAKTSREGELAKRLEMIKQFNK